MGSTWESKRLLMVLKLVMMMLVQPLMRASVWSTALNVVQRCGEGSGVGVDLVGLEIQADVPARTCSICAVYAACSSFGTSSGYGANGCASLQQLSRRFDTVQMLRDAHAGPATRCHV